MNTLKNAVVSYQTTIVGIGLLMLVVVKWVKTGELTSDDIGMVLGGFGFVAAKDAKVTGAVK